MSKPMPTNHSLNYITDKISGLQGRQKVIAEALWSPTQETTPLEKKKIADKIRTVCWPEGMNFESLFLPGNDLHQCIESIAGERKAMEMQMLWERSILFPTTDPAMEYDSGFRTERFTEIRFRYNIWFLDRYVRSVVDMLEVMAQLAARNEKVYGYICKVDTRNSTLRRLWKIRNPVSPGDAICGEPTVLDELDNDSGWNIRDDLCGYMGDISAFSLLSNVIRDGSGSMVQRKAFFDMFADENIDVYVWQFAANIIPTPAEYRRLESCLSQGDFPAVRMMLLLRTPTGLCRSVKNLIESKNAKSRRTGKTLLNIILKNNAVGYAKPIKEYLSKYN